MRKCTVLTALLVGLLLTAAGTDNRNAATWYGRAFDRLDVVTDADWDMLWTWWENPDVPPPAGFRDIVLKARPVLDLVRRGAQQEYSDFDLDRSQGLDMILPHTAQMRTAIKLMRADIMLRLHDGDVAGAADRVATMYRVSGHCGDDAMLISSLVGHAVFDYADKTCTIALDRAMFDAEAGEILHRALSSLDPDDPFNIVEAVIGEREIVADWLAAEFGDAETRAASEQAMAESLFLDDDPETRERLAGVTAMSDDEFAADLGRFDGMLDSVVGAFMMEDREAARAELEAIQEGIDAGEFGVLAGLIAPPYLKVFDTAERSRKLLAERLAMVQGLVQGEIAPEDEANAAWYYAQAIALIQEIEPGRFQLVRDLDAGSEVAPAETAAALLDEASPIIDLLRQGSQRKRCDFRYLRPYGTRRLCPEYVAGMRDVARLLHADAGRRMTDGETAAAADRLAVCHRIVGHLTGDEPIMSALVAHRVFDRTNELAEALLGTGALKPEDRAALLDAAEKIGRKDPFGYIGSVTAVRGQIVRSVDYRRWREPDNVEHIDAMIALVKLWDGDEVLYYLAIEDTMRLAGESDEQRETEAKPDPLERLDDVISLDGLEAARNEVSRVAPVLAAGEIDIFAGRDFPRFGRVVERQRFARGDLRRVVRMLRESVNEPQAEQKDES